MMMGILGELNLPFLILQCLFTTKILEKPVI